MSWQTNDITLITGAGSIKNAWLPINRALGTDEKRSSEFANTYLSGIVHELRIFSKLTVPNQEDKNLLPTFEKRQKTLLENYNELKSKISIELNNSLKNGELHLRPEFKQLISLHCEEKPNVITTNWDHAIQGFVTETWGEGNWVNFLHGSVSEVHAFTPGGKACHSLLLPSESSFEPYFSEATENHLSTYRFLAQGALSEAKKLILYGISLSPLDAELNIALSSVFNKQIIKEIIIINPMYEIIIQRLKAIKLIGKSEIKIKVLATDPTGKKKQKKINI